MTTPGSEAAGLLRELYGRGMTQREVARITGVTERMQRHVVKGSKPGTSYTQTLRELRDRGAVQAPAPVRQQRVRTSEGVSEAPRTRSTASVRPRAGSYGHSAAVTAGGAGRVETWTFPRTPGPQRAQGTSEVVQSLKRMGSQHVSLVVVMRDPKTGREFSQRRLAHGQSASSLVRAAKAHAKSQGMDARTSAALAAGILSVIASMFPNGSAGHLGANVVGLTIEG